MFKTEDSTLRVASRLLDYFGRRTPWQRRLWNVGSILALNETIEAAELVRRGHLTSGSFRDLANSLKKKLGRDPGVGGPELRRRLQQTLADVETDDRALSELTYLADKTRSGYLERWHREVGTEHKHGAEYVSRILGAHLLDAGFSPEHLHRWVSALQHDADRILDIPDLFSDAADLMNRPSFRYEVLVPMIAIPKRLALPAEWLDAPAVSNWLQERAGDPSGIRQNGGFIFRIKEKDPWAAVERAGDLMRSLAARLAVGLPGDRVFTPQREAWIAGKDRPFGFSSPRRQVDIHSLSRQEALFTVDMPNIEQQMSSAFELLAALETSTPGTAVASGWAAVETLLSRSSAVNVSAADDLALLVACSFPRAELTTLSFRYSQAHQDGITEQLEATASNRDRAAVFSDAIQAGQLQDLPGSSDAAALARMSELLEAPNQTLDRIRGYASEAFRRLYRQRNLVLHAGTIESVALRPVLRTVPPLVGAGIDRIVHAALDSPSQSAASLVARASAEIVLVGTPSGVHVIDLLDA
jgi:hypothetical protein